MTTAFACTWDLADVHTGRFTLSGELVHPHAEELLGAVDDRLDEHDDLRALLIDCEALAVCDSRGLSVLLMIRRRTESMGITFTLVNRTPLLNRLISRTGTTEYLTGE
jgi:anti-anti-sigma factor